MKLRDLILSVAALAVLIALIALADDRVRERVSAVSAGTVSHTVAEGTVQVQAATLSARNLFVEKGALTVLVALLALADDRVRERVSGMSARMVSHTVAEGTLEVQSATISARNLVVEKGALTVLVIAGAVLFVFMIRT